MRFHPPSGIVLRAGTALLLACLLALAGCQDDKEKAAALLASGRAAVEAGNKAEAIIDFRKALKADPNSAETHFALGQAYAEQGQVRDATWEFSEAARLDPKNSEAHLKLGALNLVTKDFTATLKEADLVVGLAPDNAAAYVLRGQALDGLQRPKEAEAAYLKAASLQPEASAYLYVLGQHYVNAGERDKAEPVIVKITEIDPGFRSYTNLGRFLAMDPSRDDNAEAAFRKALESTKDPKQLASGYQTLSRFYASRSRQKDAVAVLQEGFEKLASDPESQLQLTQMLAQMLEVLGRTDEATKMLEAAVQNAPDAVEPRLMLARQRKRHDDPVGALEAVEGALKADPTSVEAQLAKADYLMDVGADAKNEAQLAEARSIIDGILAKTPTQPEALYLKGRIALNERDADGAIQAFRASIDARPDSAHAHYMLGRALAASGDTRTARAEVARALELDPSMTLARRLLIQLHAALGEDEYAIDQGRIYLNHNTDPQIRLIVAQSLAHLGRVDEALAGVAQIPKDKQNADVDFARARLLMQAKKLDEARSALLSALEKRPNHPGVLATLLQVELRLGKVQRAGPRIDAALAADPNDAELVRIKGSYLAATGDVKGAEKQFVHALELDPKNVGASQQLAQIYQQTGRVDEAIQSYQKAIEQNPKSASLHHLLAELYEAQGKTQLARQGYEKAIALDPNMAQSKNNLAYLLAESGQDLDRALDLAQEAKAQQPDDPGTADTLGWVLYRRGVAGAAVGYLREAVAGLQDGSPEKGLTRYHLALAYEADNKKPQAIETLELSLADLDQQRSKAGSSTQTPPEPEWSADARKMLARLKQSG